MNLEKPKRERSRSYIDWVKAQRCFVYVQIGRILLTRPRAFECLGSVDPHHMIPKGGGITGGKVADRRCVPLCRKHHEEIGALASRFVNRYGNPEDHIAAYNREYDASHPPEPRKLRVITPTVKSLLIQCDCGKVHRIAASKVSTDGQVVAYQCGGLQHFAKWRTAR